ncbi:hypothetical protein VNO78_22787 [Psophocarpus tetragonolobus]|uniref:Uncharacterized protein n=1 Tax=Psophocarpus tetragonolobus TaxID=3891 RepID=A0AAN9XC84_PSOTE
MAGIVSGISRLAVGSGDGRGRTSPSPNSNASRAPAPPMPSEGFAYLNSGKQDIKGLTNQTGCVKGNANGVINFGTLRASASQ